ncbi:77 kDa echinoderm microtubule-associated protein-like isoform X3 [Amphiura filiformis]|uniref:77 kDa echinoderm microtubule-associated protein-like isoform X3 n=1 Tax=Amphiura filiformis TaxID=82378 RepID=UPI003B215437
MATPWSPGSDKVFWDSGEQFEADSIDGEHDDKEEQSAKEAENGGDAAGGHIGADGVGGSGAGTGTATTAAIGLGAGPGNAGVSAGNPPATESGAVCLGSPSVAGITAPAPTPVAPVPIIAALAGASRRDCNTPDSLDHGISDKQFEEFLHPHHDDDLGEFGGLDLHDRVAKLEKQVKQQQDEITCLRTALADVVRRLACVENNKYSPRGLPQGPIKIREVSGFLNNSPLPSKPSMNDVSPRSRSHRVPSTPDTKRRTASFGSSSSSSNKMKKWGSHEGLGSPQIGSKEPQYNVEEGYVRIYLRGRPVTSYMPTDYEGYSLTAKGELPSEKLKLEWVYGYRGRDCRGNLHLLPTGEIVYFMAAVVVLYNVDEGHQRHYTGHNDDVKSIAVHPDKVTIATGQVAGHDKDEGKPHVRIWDSVTLNTLHVIGLGNFDRAVCCVGFSKNDGGSRLVAVDDSNEHVLSVWDWAKEKRLAFTKSSQDPVLAAEFHPTLSGQIITCGKGHILFWAFDGSKLVKKSGIYEKYDKPKFVLCIGFATNGDVISGDSNGNIYVWGKGGNKVTYAVTGAHEGPIFSLSVLSDGSMLSGGGKDRKVISWDSSYQATVQLELPEVTGPVRTLCQGKDDKFYVGTTRNAILHGDMNGDLTAIVQAHTDELWGLAVHPNQGFFMTCAYDKQVILWDMEQHRPRWIKTMEDPCQSACFHPNGSVVAIGMSTGRWVVLDAESQDLVYVHTDGNEQHDIIRYSPDGNSIAIASHDNYIYVYSVNEDGRKYSKVGKCSGHSSFVTHVDWSADSEFLQSNSGDYELLFWNAKTCKQVTSATTMRDTEWATFTCVLGFPVVGIWAEGSDGTDVNTVGRSNNSKVLATGDDFGKVNLFKYPASVPKAPCIAYSGHSSHVTSVIFTPDDSQLITTGGRDMSCMQWKLQ